MIVPVVVVVHSTEASPASSVVTALDPSSPAVLSSVTGTRGTPDSTPDSLRVMTLIVMLDVPPADGSRSGAAVSRMFVGLGALGAVIGGGGAGAAGEDPEHAATQHSQQTASRPRVMSELLFRGSAFMIARAAELRPSVPCEAGARRRSQPHAFHGVSRVVERQHGVANVLNPGAVFS
jgi:hypothetical protein